MGAWVAWVARVRVVRGGSIGAAGSSSAAGVAGEHELRRRQALVDLQQVRDELVELVLREVARVAVLALRVPGRQDVAQGGRGAVVEVGGRLPDAEEGRRVDAGQLVSQAAPRQGRQRADVVQQAL